MGREIRRVPPHWEHPKDTHWDFRLNKSVESYIPMYDQSADEAWAEWIEEFNKSERTFSDFCEWHGTPPDPSSYRPEWKEADQTWLQVYERVSEGTPVTPPFPSASLLIDYLVEKGDFWEQQRAEEERRSVNGWERKAAERFVNDTEWMPSLLMVDGKFLEPSQSAMLY